MLSQELAGYIKDWPSQYHLTSKRSNLLRPFGKSFKGKRVLEIGCGCGAITRFIAEAGAEVIAIEGSKRRASITRNRCKDLSNVSVINCSSEKIPDIGDFDYVLLIGVLEYAQCFLGNEGQLSLLSFCKKRLKYDGSLFVAIENQLGMKYLSGAKEDHLGIPMVGINNAYHANGVRTFGRVELIQMMKNVGFSNVEEFLPFPDYKLPTLVITPYGHQKRSSVIYPLVSEVHHKDAQAPDSYTFSLEESTKIIWNNKLSSDLSNSFLMIASVSDISHESDNTLAWYYSDARINDSQKKIKFFEVNGNYKIESYKISGEFISDEPFYQGESLWLSLVSIINKHGWQLNSVIEWARLWISKALVTGNDTDSWTWNTELPPEYLDATPFNIIKTEQGYKIFDLELSSDKPLMLSYLVFRGVFNSLLRVTSIAPTKELSDFNVFTTTKIIVTEIFPELTEEHFNDYLKEEVALVSQVVNVDNNDLFERYKNSFFVVRDFLNDYKSELARVYHTNQELSSTVTNVENQIKDVEKQLKEKGEEIFGKNTLLDIKAKELIDVQESCSRLQEQIDNLLSVAAEQKSREEKLTEEVKVKTDKLQKITSSRAWKLASFFSRSAKSLNKY
ncbi:methyltransferase [Pantoea sp. Sc1]|uniref:methyltransferase domain-containing protein n=1 Tax=Pantoea sp. Sc1 TaxID=593105 RepID=UPI000317D891|nr:methyltransferase [Pantoea sp. Sc1]